MSATYSAAQAEGAQEVKVDEVEYPRVYVGNLAYSTTEEAVREHVAKAGGEIVSVVLPLKFGRKPAGYAFVAYKTEDAAKNVVEQLKDSELDGRKLSLEVARSKAEQAARREEIIQERKAAKDARIAEAKEKGETAPESGADGEAKPKKKRPAKKTTRRRQPGEEGEEGSAEAEGAAAGEEGEKPKRKPRQRKPREARIDEADGETPAEERKPKERKPRLQLTGEASKTTIFVSNLPFTVDDDALAAIFTDLSIKVKSAKVIRGIRRASGGRPFRASRGFGFVEVEDPAQQQEAVDKVEGTLIGDRTIGAKIANEMKPIEEEEAGQAAVESKETPAEATVTA